MGVTIGVAGATGALGKEIVQVLDEAPWRPERVVPLASRASSVPYVEYGETKVGVDDLAEQAMDELDVLVLAVPPDVAREAGEESIAEGVPVVDLSGVFAAEDDAPLVLPWVNPEILAELPPEGVVSLPGPTAQLLAAILGPLRRAGVVADVDATVLLPASAWGRAGIEELSAQVIALFNQGTPPRKVFHDGFAFDLLPQVGATDDSGWTVAEQRAVAEVQALTGTPGPLRATIVGVPVFSGISATLHLRTPQHLDLTLIERILSDGGATLPKAAGARYLPRPRRVDGKPFVQVGRLRQDPAGDGIHLWAALDNVRGAAAAAVATVGALLKVRGGSWSVGAPLVRH